MNAYHYLESGLPNVYLVNGPPSLMRPDIDNLHSAIGKLLVQKTGTLDGPEIRFLRKEMNRSQTVLGEHLGVCCKTVARWENGDARIRRRQDLLFRTLYLEFLDCPCPPEALARLLDDDSLDNGSDVVLLEKIHSHWRPAG